MKNIISLLSLIVLMAISTSCLKEKTEQKEVSFLNPYNFIGEFHNLGLSSIKKNLITNNHYKTFSDGDLENEIIKLSDASYRQILPSRVDLKSTFLPQIESYKIAQTCISNSQLKINQLKSGEIGNINLDIYISKLKQIISENCLSDSTTLFNNVHQIENEVYQSNLADIEKEQLLITFAVGKYSWLYWKSEFASLIQLKSTKTYQSSMVNVVNSDIEGGITGAVTGAYIGATGGTVVGPAGTLIAGVSGCLSGGAVGALSSSAFTGAKELWNTYFR